MRKLLWPYHLLLRLRYRIKIVNKDILFKKEPLLFLPNHQALVDPQILYTYISHYKFVVPIISELYFKNPILRFVLNSFGSVQVAELNPKNRETGTLQNIINQAHHTFSLQRSVLLYPSGQLANQNFEKITNKRSAHELALQFPENCRIIGVRINGLWGGMWTKHKTGKTPDFFATFIKGVIVILANFIFFTPRRTISIEFCDITEMALESAKLGRKPFNEMLENFYNEKGPDKLKIVPYFWFFGLGKKY